MGRTRDSAVINQQMLLPVSAEAPGIARELLAASLPADHPRWHDILLMGSELVTNAVLHAGMPDDEGILFVLRVDDDLVRVEVHDTGAGIQELHPHSDGLRESGYGLLLVNRLASNWGFTTSGLPTIVWFEVETS
jgi:anti-sigma regulatory factor (Ser/Thr protein kinase)